LSAHVRIGFDHLEGYLAGSIQARQAEGRPVRSPGSMNLFVGELPNRLADVPSDQELWVVCTGGRRACLAASLLDRAGIPLRLIAQSGVPEWLAHGLPRQRGI
jgi:hydroxyacylglutathione hydrolase